MRRSIGFFALIGLLALCSCTKKQESAETAKPAPEQTPAVQPAGGPHAFVSLKDGSKVGGTIVASSQKHMVLAADDGIERKIPLDQVKAVEYGEAQGAEASVPQAPRPSAMPRKTPAQQAARTEQRASRQMAETQGAAPAAAPVSAVTTKTYELPAGSEVSVRTNEAIDSAAAQEGQTFDAQVTRDATDANGDVVIPRGSPARIVIKSASQGGRIRGASDLVLDLQSVTINGKPRVIETSDISQKGKAGLGANKRTAEYAGGGAALGAVIGAIAGGGKGAAIGAGAGAGAGALAQVLTKGRAIKVPAESVLTFKLDKALKVSETR